MHFHRLNKVLLKHWCYRFVQHREAFVEAELYFEAILESENAFQIIGESRLCTVNGTLEVAVKTAICNSAFVLFVASSESLTNENFGCDFSNFA